MKLRTNFELLHFRSTGHLSSFCETICGSTDETKFLVLLHF